MSEVYTVIEDFKAGLDRRRLQAASAPGSLQKFENAVVNRGGEITKQKRWVERYALPEGTFGFIYSNDTFYVFGSGTTPGGIPSGVTYQQLSNPDSSTMTKVVMTESFKNKPYVLAAFEDNTAQHFYDGIIVTDWYVGKVRTSHTDYTGFCAALVSDFSQDPVMTAVASTNTIVLTGKTDNDTITVTASATNGGSIGDQSVTVTLTQAATVSLPQISTVTFLGTFDPGDEFTITVDDNTYGASPVTGESAAAITVLKNKMYAGAGLNLAFSATANPALWRDNIQGTTINAGSGLTDMSAQARNSENITGLGVYQNRLAIFARNTTQIWDVAADPAQNAQIQVLENTGTRSPKTVKSFGDLDVFFLADSGVRSLRARDSSNNATVNDVGTAIDEILIEHMKTLTDAQIIAACAEIEPRDGRYIMSLDDIQYWFSFFPSAKISAWSTATTDLVFTDFTVREGRLYGRAGDTIYVLGGDDDDRFTTETVTVEIPYIDGRSTATWKEWAGIDIICEGVWDIYVNTNPKQPDVWTKTARITGTTVNQMGQMMQQWGPMFKLKFEHQDDDDTIEARLSKIIVHYNKKKAE